MALQPQNIEILRCAILNDLQNEQCLTQLITW